MGVSFSDKLVLVTEFIDGETLDVLIRKGLSVQEGIYIAKQIAEGMSFLHSNIKGKPPIIHRDLKPANIMVTNTNHIVKIIDLGISALTKI